MRTRTLVLCLVASLGVVPAAWAAEAPKPQAPETAVVAAEQPAARPVSTPLTAVQSKALAGNLHLVFFEEAPLATYAGGVEGLAATSPAATGKTRLDARSPASRAYLSYLERRQQQHLAAIEGRLERDVEVVFRYRAAANGIAAALTPAEAKSIRDLPGVVRVVRDSVARLDTDRGPTWIGAPGIWDGSATGGLGSTMGEGVVIGVIDSGVNMDHPSFAEVGGDGFTHINPFGAGQYIGWCDPTHPDYDPTLVCNEKLIGVYDYTDAYCAANPTACSETDGPEDDNGHGSHTASTAAGNVLLSPEISGVAPHANLITYDACYTDATGQGLCPFTATSAAVDQAVLDGVKATNYSIGGGTNPWAGDIDTFFLGAVAAGIYPAASAGNSGPGPATLGHLGPWVSTTGASTHDRLAVENQLINMSGGVAPPPDITGASRTTGYGPETVVYAGDFANGDPDPEQCLNPFPPGTWTAGEIVLCDRGTIARVAKCANVQAGGAGGCILANANAGQTDPVADAHVIPAIHVNLADGDVLRAWLAVGTGHTATITDSVILVDPALADIMANFSSRGPNDDFSVLKPDLTAPGVSIFAAFNSGGGLPPPEYGAISGTSMSGPHNAGSGALLAGLGLLSSPAAIKSVLMMTADTTVLKEDGLTAGDPFDFGGGRIDLTKAARAGVILDESHADFLAADPAAGGDPSTLNLPSLQQNACVVSCSWTRTVTSVSPNVLTWTVSTTTPAGMTLTADPSVFVLAPTFSQTIEFTATPSGLPLDVFAFAEVQLTEFSGTPDLHFPVAVRPALDNFPELVEITAFDRVDSQLVTGLRAAVAITDLDVQANGLALGTTSDILLFQDPTNGAPYDDLSQVFVRTVSVPSGARRLVAITSSDEAPDVDLYVGTGAIPGAGTEVCSSTTPEADERCELIDPAPGTYWILVQNWAGSANQPDAIRLVDGVTPGTDAGNFGATGPMTVPIGDPFDLNIFWNEPSMLNDQVWFGALDIGTDPGNPGNLGTIGVDLTFFEGEIFADGFESGDTSAWSGSVP